MLQQQRLNHKGEQYVIGPTGAPLTVGDLPPPNTQRWVIRRKAEVVAAVRGGLLSLDDACGRYRLTTEAPGLRAAPVAKADVALAMVELAEGRDWPAAAPFVVAGDR